MRAEKIEVSEDEINDKIGKLADGMGISREVAENYFGAKKARASLEADIKVEKAVKTILDSADMIEVEKKAEPQTSSTEAENTAEIQEKEAEQAGEDQ